MNSIPARVLCALLFLAAAFPLRGAGNALDRIDFGDLVSERVHQFAGGGTAGSGPHSKPWRKPVGASSGGGTFTFTMGCDPVRQNYASIKLWGNDGPQSISIQGLGTEENGGPVVFPNRFYYYTMPIPIAQTTGKTSLTVTVSLPNLGNGATGKALYSAFTHTQPQFAPEAADVVGTAPARTGWPTLDTLTLAEAVAQMRTARQNYFDAGGYLDDVIARQVPVGQPGAPVETVGLDLFTTVSSWVAANPGATPDQWRDRIAGVQHGPGYTNFPDELLSVLTSAYLLPPFTDATGAVVAGLDRYRDATLLDRIVRALDSSTYLQGSDGGFHREGDDDANGISGWYVWHGLCSTPRAAGHYMAGSAARGTTWTLSLEGVDTQTLGWTLISLLNDPVGGPALITRLGQSFDADLNGGSMLRAHAYERMLFNHILYLRKVTGGAMSQNMFQELGMYAAHVAMGKIQALFPNAAYVSAPPNYPNETYVAASATARDVLNMTMGVIPTTLRGPRLLVGGVPVNYSHSIGGLGEAHGMMSTGFDGGGYGQIVAWLAPRFADFAVLDSTLSAADRAAISERANASINGFNQFLSPFDGATVTNGVLTANTLGFGAEPWITYRDVKNPNTSGGGLNFNAQYPASRPGGPMANAYARRAAYLLTQYGTVPGFGAGNGPNLNYARDTADYEATLRSLVGVNPATLTPLPAEPGQPDFAWADVQAGAVAVINNGERFYMNANWRNADLVGLGNISRIARVHHTTGTIERAAEIIMPKDAANVQADGNVTAGVWAGAHVVRWGDYLVAFNNSGAGQNVALPAGASRVKNLINGAFHTPGTTAAVPAGQTAVFYLAAAPLPTGAGVPTIATAAAASGQTATAVNLSVLGADDGGEAALIHTWGASGPGNVSYTSNGTYASRNTTATFSSDGVYDFTVTVRDAGGNAVASSVTVTVSQAVTSLAISPTSITLVSGGSQQFAGQALDQFGMPMETPVALTWALTSGTGSVNALGLYTAPAAAGSASVRVNTGALTATANVAVLGPVGVFGGSQTIGSPSLAGAASFSGGTYTLSAGGNDIWGTSDQLRFTYLPLTGDGTMTARVLTQSNTNANAKAGVMFRNSLDANSAYAFGWSDPAARVLYEARAGTGANSYSSGPTAAVTFPKWIRLTRRGDTFTVESAPDAAGMPGVWTQLNAAQTIAMNETAYVGLAVCSHSTGALLTATFDNVSVTQPTYIFPATKNIGGTTAGVYSDDGATVTLTGTGGDIWNTADNFQFAYKAMTGDCSLTARVVSITGAATNPKVGVMIRDTLDAGSKQVSTLTRPQLDIRQARRTATNGNTTETGVGTFTQPYWLRVTRTGNVLSSWRSPDGTAGSWVQVSGNQTITMGTTVQVGLAVASLNGAASCTTTFDNISLTGTVNAAPTIATQPSGTVTNATSALSVLGADADGGEGNLTYAWELLGLPPAGVTFSATGTNAAKNVTATFGAPGTYYLRASATDSGGSAAVSDLLGVGVGAPTGLTATAGNTSVALVWTSAWPGATGYRIYRATVSGGPYALIGTANGTSFPGSGLTNGTPYFYVVTALQNASESPASVPASATPHVTFASWQAQWFTAGELGNPLISGATADANGDGVKNLLAYSMNLSPWVAATSALPTADLIGGYLTLSFIRRKTPTDLTYTVEVTGNLLAPPWNFGPASTTQTGVMSLDALTERVTVRDHTPASGPPRFIRLRVDQ